MLVKDGAYGTLIQCEGLKEARLSAATLALSHDQKRQQRPPQPHPARRRAEDRRRALSQPAPISSPPTPSMPTASASPTMARKAWCADINRAAARIIREVADEASATGGSAGWPGRSARPTRRCRCRPTSTIPAIAKLTFEEVKAVYREQIDALVEGGVDFVLIETVFDTLNCKAAIMAALEAEQALGRELPIMISMTLTDLQRPQSQRPYGRGFLGNRSPCQATDNRAELLVRGGAAEAAPRRAGAEGRDLGHGLSQCRPAQRAWLL